MVKGKIHELFTSIQGEGLFVGTKQVFIRLQGCNLDGCRFCDTRIKEYNLYTPLALFEAMRKLNEAFHSVCLTGGEPLMQYEFLEGFISLLKDENLVVHLETNGILYKELSYVIGGIDVIAMDAKLPSSTALGPFWNEHRRFLREALKAKVFVKTVICLSSTKEDLLRCVDLLASTDNTIPLVLQPNHFEMGGKLTKRLLEFQDLALESLANVRIVPQVHKIMGVR